MRPAIKRSKGSPQRPLRPIIRVLTEGRKTEPQYIKLLNREYRNVRIDIDPKDTGLSAISLLQRAREYKRKNSRKNPAFDEIWIIFDVDDNSVNTINKVIQEATDSDIKIAISNPCFELWLVLHYQDQTGYIERRKIQSRAKALGIIKGKATADQTLIEKYGEARNRAKNLETKHRGDGSKPWENPSSQIWKFVDRVIAYSTQNRGK